MGKYRMYSIVLRQLSPIQKGIHSAHSIVEYARKFHKTSEYIQWVSVDKDIIILDCDTYSEMRECLGILEMYCVPYSVFYDKNMGGISTSVSFIMEDKIWDESAYPSYDGDIDDISSESDSPIWLIMMGGKRNLELRKFLKGKNISS